jgi:hypothetical protein
MWWAMRAPGIKRHRGGSSEMAKKAAAFLRRSEVGKWHFTSFVALHHVAFGG